MRYLISPLILFLLAACAGTPVFDTSQVDNELTPQSVIAYPESSQGKLVLWGGTILEIQNLKDSTQIEILAHPLNSSQRPRQNKKPLGRFIVIQPGFLEPAIYAQGHLLTVLGKVGDSEQGKVGESNYTYAVITAEKLKLWSPRDESGQTRFHFGIGISF